MPVSSYVEVKRTWKSGDTIEITLPKTLRLEPTPDMATRAAIMWGPLVMAGDFGFTRPDGADVGSGPSPDVPVFVAADKPLTEWLKPVAGTPGQFRSDGVGRGTDLNFRPFYQLHQHTYGIYFDIFTPAQWATGGGLYTAEQVRERNLATSTVGFAQPGQMQPERDFNYQGSGDSSIQRAEDRPGRQSGGWFSFDLPVEPAHPMVLMVTYYSGQQPAAGASFEVQVDGRKVGDQKVENAATPAFLDVRYALPDDLVKGKQKVTVRFQAASGSRTATVFGIRMMRADAPQ
jgi:hypothetical protein